MWDTLRRELANTAQVHIDVFLHVRHMAGVVEYARVDFVMTKSHSSVSPLPLEVDPTYTRTAKAGGCLFEAYPEYLAESDVTFRYWTISHDWHTVMSIRERARSGG